MRNWLSSNGFSSVGLLQEGAGSSERHAGEGSGRDRVAFFYTDKLEALGIIFVFLLFLRAAVDQWYASFLLDSSK